MAQVRFDEVDFSNGSGSKSYDVGFFSLKNDNDEAVVRIMHDSVNDFDIITTHEVKEDGKYRGRVSCIRSPREELSKCPICASGAPVAQRMYIHLIQYVTDENGNIVPQPVVWERSISYANQIKSYIDNYGPLSDIICKIIRHGKPRDQNTRYEIIPNLNKQVYREDIYVKDTSLFDGFTSEGTVVQKRTYEELDQFVKTGRMPQRTRTNNVPNTIPTNSANVPNNTTVYTSSMPAYTQPAQQFTQPAYVGNVPNVDAVPFDSVPQTPMPSIQTFPQTTSAGLERPTRQYY